MNWRAILCVLLIGSMAAWSSNIYPGVIREIPFAFDAGNNALTGSMTRCNIVTFQGTIAAFYMLADQTGSITVDLKTVAFGSYTGPASASSITGGTPPAISSAITYSNTTLSGWTTFVPANTVVCFAMSGPSSVQWVQGKIKFTVTN